MSKVAEAFRRPPVLIETPAKCKRNQSKILTSMKYLKKQTSQLTLTFSVVCGAMIAFDWTENALALLGN